MVDTEHPATSKINPTFDYFDKLITSWHDRNLKTTQDIQNYITY